MLRTEAIVVSTNQSITIKSLVISRWMGLRFLSISDLANEHYHDRRRVFSARKSSSMGGKENKNLGIAKKIY